MTTVSSWSGGDMQEGGGSLDRDDAPRGAEETYHPRSEALPLVMTVEELRRAMNISRVKAYELVHQKNFPVIRIGRSIRVIRDGFLRWLDGAGNGA